VSEELLRRGQKLDRYELRELIGQGGMGQVYRAWDTVLSRDVAVKVLTITDADMLKRFAREAEAIGRLDNHNVVDIHDLRIDGAHPYIVMEYLRGENLNARLKRGALSVAEAVEVILGVCCGVAACHRVGIIHRDLKPGNVFLAETADYGVVVKVLDFGVAKPAQLAEEVTGPGKVVGTPRYLSPEQLDGGTADELSDQYQIGLLLYVCLSGKPPFGNIEKDDLVRAVMSSDYPGLREERPEIPPGLEQVISRAMSAERGRRYPSVIELGRALVGYATPEGQALWAEVFEHSDAHSAVPVRLTQEELSGSATKVDGRPAGLEDTQLVESGEVARMARQSVEKTEQGGSETIAVRGQGGGMAPVAPLDEQRMNPPLRATGTDTKMESLVTSGEHGRAAKLRRLWEGKRRIIGVAFLALSLGGIGAVLVVRASSGEAGPKWSSAKLDDSGLVRRDGGGVGDVLDTRRAEAVKGPEAVEVEEPAKQAEGQKVEGKAISAQPSRKPAKKRVRKKKVEYTSEGSPILE
jgi:serine/threonine protein kinase